MPSREGRGWGGQAGSRSENGHALLHHDVITLELCDQKNAAALLVCSIPWNPWWWTIWNFLF